MSRKVSPAWKAPQPTEIVVEPSAHRYPPDLVGAEHVDWRDVNYLGEQIADLEKRFAQNVVNVLDEGVVGDGVVDDTLTIHAAMARSTELGLPVYFPHSPGCYRLTAALTPAAGQYIILTPTTIMEQVTKYKPVFDILDKDGVTVDGHGALLRYTGDRTWSAGTAFRGAAEYTYSAGVWSNSNWGTIRDLRVEGLTSGVVLSGWNGTALANYAHKGNWIEHIGVDNVDFGLLFEGQDALHATGIRGRTVLSPGSGNPNHILYVSWAARNRDLVISDIEEWSDPGSPTPYAVTIKATDGGVFSNILARGTAGVLTTGGTSTTPSSHNTDLTITNVVGRDQQPNGSGLLYMQGGDQRLTIDTLDLHAADGIASDRAIRFDGIDCALSNVTIRARHSANASSQSVHVLGTRNRIDGISLLNLQDNGSDATTGWRGIWIASSSTDCFVRPLVLRNMWQFGVEIASAAVNPRLDLSHAKISFVSGGTISSVLNSSTTATIFQQSASFNVKAYGAIGDGVINDVAAIQSAIDAAVAAGGGTVEFPVGSFKVNTPIQLKPGVFLRGAGSSPSAGNVTKLLGQAGQNVIALPSSGANVGCGVENLMISGGLNGIYAPAAASYDTYLRLRDLHIAGPSQSCIEVLARIEEWDLAKVSLYAGQYGFRYNGARMDKCHFTDVECKQQSINGFNITVSEFSGACTWDGLILHNSAQHGFVAKATAGNIRSWLFLNPYAEGTGSSGKSNRTTGSVTTGTTALTVADATGLAQNDPIVVAGAGLNGADLFTTIAAIAGTAVTLAAAAGTTVTTAPVTNASSDEFFFDTPSLAADITVIGALFQGDSGGGHVRYSIHTGGIANSLSLIGCNFVQPVYDPLRVTHVLGRSNVRQPANFLNYNLTHPTFAGPGAGEMVRTLIPSPPGRDVVLALRDSADNTGGSFGNLEVRRNDGNKTAFVQANATTMDLRTRGRILEQGLAGWATIPAGTTTPDVVQYAYHKTANTGATTITNFLNGVQPQTITIHCSDANTTIANNATIATNTGANKLLVANRIYRFTLSGTVWIEDA